MCGLLLLSFVACIVNLPPKLCVNLTNYNITLALRVAVWKAARHPHHHASWHPLPYFSIPLEHLNHWLHYKKQLNCNIFDHIIQFYLPLRLLSFSGFEMIDNDESFSGLDNQMWITRTSRQWSPTALYSMDVWMYALVVNVSPWRLVVALIIPPFCSYVCIVWQNVASGINMARFMTSCVFKVDTMKCVHVFLTLYQTVSPWRIGVRIRVPE